MDDELNAMIERERAIDEDFFAMDDEALDPISVLDDGQGGTIEVYADGSFCTKTDGRLAPGRPEALSAP